MSKPMSTEEGSTTDEQLVALLQAAPEGDTRPFEQLVTRHQNRVLANCRYMTRSAGIAEDLAQEVFVKAYYGLQKFEGRSTFKTWLHRIKVNHCLSHIQKQKDKRFVDIEDVGLRSRPELSTAGGAEKHLKSRTDRERISAILDEMIDTLRLPLLLRDLDGLSYQEIAEELGVGLSAVKMRIKRGREEFRRRWEDSMAAPAAAPEAVRGEAVP